MTEEEARRANEEAAAPLMCLRDPEEEGPGDEPINALLAELEAETRFAAARGKRKVGVAQRLAHPSDLRLALTVPTAIVWYEESGRTVTDPMSGNARREKIRRVVAAPCAKGVGLIKIQFAAYLHALAVLARRVGSPAFDDLRACSLALETWNAQHSPNAPLDEPFVDDLLAKLDAALFVLAFDVRIWKEA